MKTEVDMKKNRAPKSTVSPLRIKKYVMIAVAVVICAAAGYLVFLHATDQMLVRPPLIVHQKPKITFFVGKVTYREDEHSEWFDAEIGTNLGEGYELKTERKSYADIGFHKHTAIRVLENSLVKISELNIKTMQLDVKAGSILGKFEKLFNEHDISVHTPISVASVRGTDLAFEVGSMIPESEKKKPAKKRKNKKEPDEPVKERMINYTKVYALNGITEIYNPLHAEDKVLLSYQQEVDIKEGEPIGEPKAISPEDLKRINEGINLIHEEEVLFISNKILFKFGSAEILPGSNAELDKVVQMLKDKKVRVRIEGHTDNISSPAINYNLSVKRATAIKDYLISKGVKENRLFIKGYGQTRPVSDNLTEAGREQNRRVEFIIAD
jgi:outer membrane protein OmpA-like peptidoglycan-associated protein